MRLIFSSVSPVLNSLKETYDQALRRDDIKAIVITGAIYIAYGVIAHINYDITYMGLWLNPLLSSR